MRVFLNGNSERAAEPKICDLELHRLQVHEKIVRLQVPEMNQFDLQICKEFRVKNGKNRHYLCMTP